MRRSRRQTLCVSSRKWRYTKRERFFVVAMPEYVRAYAAAMLERGDRAGDAPRLIEAVYASLPVPAEQITAPTLVIHETADPVIRYTAGLSTVRAIRGAHLLTVEGMGHDLTSPRAFPWLVQTFAHHAQTAPPMWVRDGRKAPSVS